MSFFKLHLFTTFALLFFVACDSDNSNSGTQSTNSTNKDGPSPALVLEDPSTSPSTDPTPSIRVSGVEEGATVTLYSDSSCDTQASDPVEVGSEGEVSLESYPLTDQTSDVELKVSFYAAEKKGEEGDPICLSESVSYVLDLAAPAAPSALALEEPSSSPGNDPTPTLEVSGVEAGAIVTLYSDHSCDTQVSDGVQVMDSVGMVSITSYSLEDGTQDIERSFYAIQRDRAGNKSACSTAKVSYILDVMAPAAPSALALEEPSTSPGTDPTPTLEVSGVVEGATVALYSDSSCDVQVSEGVEVAEGVSVVSITSNTLGDGTQDMAVTFYAAQTDGAGNKSACSMSVSYALDAAAPASPTALALEDPSASPGSDPIPSIRVSGVEEGAIVTLYRDSSCDTAVSLPGTVAQGQTSIILTSHHLGNSDVTLNYYAAQEDIFERSSCSTASVAYTYLTPILVSEVSLEVGSYFYDDPSSDTLEIGVTFNKNVKVTGVPRLELTIGSATKYATYTSGTGSSTLIFSYDVSSDDYDNDGVEIAANIELNNGMIKGALNEDVPLSFTAPDSLGRVWINFEEKIFSSDNVGFAFLKKGGSLVVWGRAAQGGNVGDVSSELERGVREVFSNNYAFAALKDDGSVVTWGTQTFGGDSSSVSSGLAEGIVRVFSTAGAFAALKDDGSVVTWGNSGYGGDSESLSSALEEGVVEIFSTYNAFAALKDDGSIISWGASGGISFNSVSSDLDGEVKKIFSTSEAFAALKNDGSVITWGSYLNGGDSWLISSDLGEKVEKIYSNTASFVAIKDDGSVITWGNPDLGGDSSSVSSHLTEGVEKIFSNNEAFAALKDNGSVVAWGNASRGGNTSAVSSDLEGDVAEIYSNAVSFLALKNDGSMVTWGSDYRIDEAYVVPFASADLSGEIAEIYSTDKAFALLKSDGSVVTWGNEGFGGDSATVSSDLREGVVEIFPNSTYSLAAFAALKDDGSVTTWGASAAGGDSSSVSSDLREGVIEIFSNRQAFAALKEDGSVITWGNFSVGGDSSNVDLGARW